MSDFIFKFQNCIKIYLKFSKYFVTIRIRKYEIFLSNLKAIL